MPPGVFTPPSAPMLRLVEQAPKSYRSGQMAAVQVPSPYGGGTSGFGDDEEHSEALVLDLQVTPTTHNPGIRAIAPPKPEPAPAPKPIAAIPLGRMADAYLAAAARRNPRPGIVAFAGYGIPPTVLSRMPAYALRVMVPRPRNLAKRLEDRTACRNLPQREIELYEAAIRCANESVMTKGIAVVVTSIVGLVGLVAALATVL